MDGAGDLTLQEAADALDVHYMTAYRYVRLGLLPAHRRGRTWVVARADLAAFLQERAADQAEPTAARSSVDWALRLQRRLLAGDRLGSKNVVEASLAAGTEPVGVYLDVVGPAMLVAVAVSATTPGNDDAVQATVAAARERVDVPVLLGGGAVPDAAASVALGADGWAADARGAVALLEGLQDG